ncbi:MAG: ATP-binding protein [Abyssibacter sp.]|uniref:ATP-binding protein n=1 Tax=Abyssibacter sp. TaxID=2320200 RepID=UPI00321B5451
MVVTLAGRPQARSTQETLVQPRIPRAAALCLALAAVALGALTLAGSQEAAQWGATWMQTLSPQASIALIGSAFGLVLLLSGWRRTGVLSAALGTGFAALEVLAMPLTPLGEFWATQASNSGSRTLGLTLFAASTATLLMGWQHAGASRWAGVELTTAFLVAVGAVGILSAGGAGGSVMTLGAGLPTPAALGVMLIGLGLQGLILDPTVSRRRRLRPLMFALSVVALGVWLAVALAQARPDSGLDALVLVVVLAAGPVGAWFLARSAHIDEVPTAETAYTPVTESHALEQLRVLAETSEQGVCVVDGNGRLTLFNGALQAMYGFRDKPFLGHASANVFRVYDTQSGLAIPWNKTPLARAMRGQRVENFEFSFHKRDGSVVHARASAHPVRDERGLGVGAIMSVEDITQAREQSELLRRQAELVSRTGAELERVAFIAAHHLQEPVRGISSYAQLLSRRVADNPDVQDYVRYLTQESGRIKSLTRDLLAYLETATRPKMRSSVDLQAVVNAARQTIAKRYPDRELICIKGALPIVTADPALLTQLFEQLFDNTVKFSDNTTPSVTIDCTPQAEEWALTVTDNGPGIPAEHAEKVFELFAQLHTIGTYPGNGLGLALAKKILLVHGGRIRVDTATERGLKLHLLLPYRPPSVELDVTADAAAPEPAAGREAGEEAFAATGRRMPGLD